MTQRHLVSTAPLARAKRAASSRAVPVAPNGLNVTGAAARAAASAAVCAWEAANKYRPVSASTNANAAATRATANTRIAAAPRSALNAHRSLGP